MQGLGLFACRREAWPGFNPRFRGFGGEEGYLHEKVRRNGGRVLCLPALGWTHRFARPLGPPYRPTWEDRVRNYRIGWFVRSSGGAGRSDGGALPREHVPDNAETILSQTSRQLANPFMFFDAIFCLNIDAQVERWEAMVHRFRLLDIAGVERFPAVVTPDNPHRGCALSFRAMIAEAKLRGYANVLIFEDDALFLDTTLDVVRAALADLRGRSWDVLYLGGAGGGRRLPFAESSDVLQRPHNVTCTHALAFNHTAYDRLLADLPSGDDTDIDAWMEQHVAVDQYLWERIADEYTSFITWPRVAEAGAADPRGRRPRVARPIHDLIEVQLALEARFVLAKSQFCPGKTFGRATFRRSRTRCNVLANEGGYQEFTLGPEKSSGSCSPGRPCSPSASASISCAACSPPTRARRR